MSIDGASKKHDHDHPKSSSSSSSSSDSSSKSRPEHKSEPPKKLHTADHFEKKATPGNQSPTPHSTVKGAPSAPGKGAPSFNVKDTPSFNVKDAPPTPISPSQLAAQMGLPDPAQPPPIGPVKQDGLPICVAQPPPVGPTIGPASPEAVQQMATEQLTKAQAQYDAAKAQTEALDQQLASELAHAGPSMTKEQQAAYVEAYHGAHPEYEQVKTAEANLEKALSNPDLQDAIKADPKAAQAAYQGLKSLASSPLGGRAVEIARGWKADAATWKAFSAATPDFEQKFPGEILGPGVAAGAVGDIGNGVPPSQAAEHVLAALQLFGALATLPEDVTKLLEKIKQGGLPSPSELQGLATGFEELSALGKSIGGVAALLSLGLAAKAGLGGDYMGALGYTLNGGTLGAPLLAEMLKTTSWGMSLPGAGTAVKFLDWAGPWLGVASSAVATYQDWMALQDPNSPKAGLVVTMLGDLISSVGSAMMFAPGLQLEGAVTAGVGTVIAMGGYGVTQLETHASRMAEERALLERVFKSEGMPASKAEGLADAIVRDVFPRGSGDPAAAQSVFQPVPVGTPRPPPVEVPPVAVPTPPPAATPVPRSTPIPIRG